MCLLSTSIYGPSSSSSGLTSSIRFAGSRYLVKGGSVFLRRRRLIIKEPIPLSPIKEGEVPGFEDKMNQNSLGLPILTTPSNLSQPTIRTQALNNSTSQ